MKNIGYQNVPTPFFITIKVYICLSKEYLSLRLI